MRFSFSSATLIAISFATTTLSIAVRSATPCTTVASGIFGGYYGNFTIDSESRLVLNGGATFNVDFQSCPESGTIGAGYRGRILIQDSTECLTVTNPTASAPWLVSAETCTSDTTPSVGETWEMDNEFDGIYWLHEYAGYEVGGTTTLAPVLVPGTDQLQLYTISEDSDIIAVTFTLN